MISSASFILRCFVAVLAVYAGWIDRCMAADSSPTSGSDHFQQSLQTSLDKAGSSSSMTIPGVDGWLFLDKELRHLSAPKFWSDLPESEADSNNPLPAILDFKAQLDKAGVDLLLVPVPTKAAIYPDKLMAGNPIPPQVPADLVKNDPDFYKLLESRGVKVLDLTETFLDARKAESPDLYCKTDTHWAPPGIQLAAKKIAERSKGLPWVNTQPKVVTKAVDVPLEIHGDLAASLIPPQTTTEPLTSRFIGLAASAGLESLPNSKSSPIILLGDSHNLVFHSGGDMHSVGAGLSDQLSHELGFPLDVIAVMGSGATSARRNLARRKDNLVGRRLVIWCFTAREFTQGQGWAKVPLIKETTTATSLVK
jgi:alginate O-acetyltransferase complex protein AlgJ